MSHEERLPYVRAIAALLLEHCTLTPRELDLVTRCMNVQTIDDKWAIDDEMEDNCNTPVLRAIYYADLSHPSKRWPVNAGVPAAAVEVLRELLGMPNDPNDV